MGQPWLYGAIILLLFVHGAMLASAYRSGESGKEAGSERGQHEKQNSRVECAHCGELNEMRYRYCRQCVSELPMNEWVAEDDAPLRGRRTL